MTETATLRLPYILPSQSQKHVTHNEALLMLDVLVQLAVADRDLTEPPAAPEDGDRYIVAAGASGGWQGRDGEVAAWQDGAWTFFAPHPGWRAFVADEQAIFWFDGTQWTHQAASGATLQEVSLLGLGTTADAANPFAAKLNKALWTARYTGEDGDGDLRYTLNKQEPAGVLSLLMQSDWSGRAEFGLIGDDDFSLKVSPDGQAWTTAIAVDAASGRVRLPAGIAHETGAEVAQYVPTIPDNVWRLDASRAATPRLYALATAADGDRLALAPAGADTIFSSHMSGKVAVRIWNTSKSPAESAWVNERLSSTELRVTDAAHVAGWSGGDTIRLGDPNPTGTNTLNLVAIDISGLLQAEFGTVFPQKGLMLALYVASGNGPAALDFSGTGASGTASGGNALSDGTRNQMTMPLATPTPSPISNSNLVFVREAMAGTATDIRIAFARMIGVYV